MLGNYLPYIALAILMIIGVVSDLKSNRIPNLLIITGIILASIFHSVLFGLQGMVTLLLGAIAGLLLLLPFYLVKAMGAGDVKFMSMVGAFLGYQVTALAVGLTLIVGGVIAISLIVYKQQAGLTFNRYRKIFVTTLYSRKPFYIPPQGNEFAGTKFPYALAIALGTLWACYLRVFPILEELML